MSSHEGIDLILCETAKYMVLSQYPDSLRERWKISDFSSVPSACMDLCKLKVLSIQSW